jgi:phospholipid-binding lipoprotein MlaA
MRSAFFLRWKLLVLCGVLGLLQACASVPNKDRRDPFESVNRTIFNFNDAVDQAVVKPAATAYRDVLPSWVRKGIGNFFNNLDDVWSVVNNAVQLRSQDTGDSLARVMINSTLGVGGVFDLASDLNIERHTADFGLTLGRWGIKSGPYVVIPFLGPSTLRNVIAKPVDMQGNLLNQIPDDAAYYGLTALDLIDLRAST